MRELSIKEIQKIEFDILIEIDNICRKNNLRYTLSNGTLLGAVRHKGFIPWDNDADIRMPRPDYNKFVDYCMNNETKFKLYNVLTDKKCYVPFSRMYDEDTVYVRRSKKYSFGAFVDLFPIDGIGKDNNLLNLKNINLQKSILYFNQFDFPPISNKKKLKTNIFHFIYFCQCKILGAKEICKKFYDNVSFTTYEESHYVTNLSSRNYDKQIYTKSMYEELIEIEFEGYKFYCVKDYDLYLKTEYGDYMVLPPIEKRGDHHKFKIYKK